MNQLLPLTPPSVAPTPWPRQEWEAMLRQEPPRVATVTQAPTVTPVPTVTPAPPAHTAPAPAPAVFQAPMQASVAASRGTRGG